MINFEDYIFSYHMDDKKRIVILIKALLADQALVHFLRSYDFSLNLFGLRISDTRHLFLRISCPQEESVLWMQEEYIPQKDSRGNWIQHPPIENPRVERIMPSMDYIPVDSTYDGFVDRLMSFLEELGSYGVKHLKNRNASTFNADLGRVRQSIQTLV